MKRITKIAPVMLLALCVGAVSWAGGPGCTDDGAKASATDASKASATATGSHCTGKGASAASQQTCALKTSQVMYSFSVPSVECEHCVEAIQKAAMETKGIACAHVDLSTHIAYIIADKNVKEKTISAVIAEAGYKNKYKGKGSKVEAAFAKSMASGDKNMACCAKSKDKV